MKKLVWIILLATAVFLSCSNVAPRMDALSYTVVNHPGGTQTLSFFVLANDEDGFIDIDELHLLNDKAQLFWTLKAGQWLKTDKGGNAWIGSHAITMNDGRPFPAGPYRAVIKDKGGNSSEKQFYFDPAALPTRPFPTLKVAGGQWQLSSEYPKNSLVLYNATGVQLKTLEVDTKEGSLASLNAGQSQYSLALWAEDEDQHVAALTYPVPVK